MAEAHIPAIDAIPESGSNRSRLEAVPTGEVREVTLLGTGDGVAGR